VIEVEETRIHSQPACRSIGLVEVFLVAFVEYPLLGCRHKDLGNSVKYEDHTRVQASEGVAEVDQRSDEDNQIENERTDIGDGHCEEGINEIK
jgi:hypothetical protein